MKNLIKWLTKHNYYFKSDYIGENYFFNIPAIHFNCVLINLEFSVDYAASRDRYLLNYINKYYGVVSSGFNASGCWYIVTRKADKEAYNLYRAYMDRSIKQFEIVQHNYYIGRIKLDNLNQTTRNIMIKWENRYKKALEKAA